MNIPTLEDFNEHIPAMNLKYYAWAVTTGWTCPCCDRSVFDIMYRTESGKWRCDLHVGHDHGDPARFDPLLICAACNGVDTKLKTYRPSIDQSFSLTPDEIRQVITPVAHAPSHKADYAKASLLYDLVGPRARENVYQAYAERKLDVVMTPAATILFNALTALREDQKRRERRTLADPVIWHDNGRYFDCGTMEGHVLPYHGINSYTRKRYENWDIQVYQQGHQMFYFKAYGNTDTARRENTEEKLAAQVKMHLRKTGQLIVWKRSLKGNPTTDVGGFKIVIFQNGSFTFHTTYKGVQTFYPGTFETEDEAKAKVESMLSSHLRRIAS